jgi:hypothetical protein
MNKLLAIALAVSLVMIGWLAFHLLDAAISLDHARQGQASDKQQIRLMRSMLEHTTTGISRSDLLRLLADDLGGERIVKKDDDRIEVDSVTFVFRNDKVSNVLVPRD